ncbi:putative Suppressor of glycerol defect protein 1 [Blattamonas nauphoetae]|uniref:Suppressor of glycerol defect protein 1 n=1 Tax=Blattamonas nauphoetae TaxID=2049346 RepID=A0ABQ9YFV7_9EUKA|nr:putative Suppressor of glycerol defect protein 1 [Blattamonas nauphoetae]
METTLSNEGIRAIRGSLNKMMPNTFALFASQILEVLRDYSLGSVLQSLIPIVMKACTISQAPLKDCALFSGVFAKIHREIPGATLLVASSLLETMVQEFSPFFGDKFAEADQEHMYRSQQLCAILGSLYTYGICSSKIVYDVLELLVNPLFFSPNKATSQTTVPPIHQRGEHCVMILSIFQTTSWRLQTDTSRLSELATHFVESYNLSEPVQQSPDSDDIDDDSFRGRYLSETLLIVLLPYSSVQVTVGNARRLKSKAGKGLTMMNEMGDSITIRDVQYSVLSACGYDMSAKGKSGKGKSMSTIGDDELDVGWETLTDPEKKNRWWMVGSSYESQNVHLSLQTMSGRSVNQDEQPSPSPSDPNAVNSKTVNSLARDLRLSTGGRKAILAALMGAFDCEDACERIVRLGLKGLDARDIAAVIVECCAQERHYNPFYSYTAVLVCKHHRSHVRSFTNVLHDFITELKDGEQRRTHHIAMLTALLICEGGVPLSVVVHCAASGDAEDDKDSQQWAQLAPKTPDKMAFALICLGSMCTQTSLDGAREAVRKAPDGVRDWAVWFVRTELTKRRQKTALALVKLMKLFEEEGGEEKEEEDIPKKKKRSESEKPDKIDKEARRRKVEEMVEKMEKGWKKVFGVRA